MPPFSLSPSLVARFFFHDCDRYLRYQATPKVQRREAGIPDIAWDTSPVTAAILERGYSWEKVVLRKYLPGKVRIASGKGPVTERVHDLASTIKHLAQLQPGEAIYQPTIKVPPSFQQHYGLSPDLCDFPPCRPDLLQATDRSGRLSLRVIDLKASAVAKMSHRIQAALYALMLREVAHAAQLPLPVDTEEGGIWLIDQPDPEWSDLRPSVAMVERFLVWGPPGTGKTHFLAKAILSLAKARKTKGLGLQVAVTAFTHAAIENILAEVKEQIANFGLEKDLSLYKLKHASTPRGQGLEVIEEKALPNVMQEDLLVVGGTVYSFAKVDVGGFFPLLIIDEASQMKIGEFALALTPLSALGHIVLAGDDLQLPPIIKGVYPEPADGLPGLHESIFAFLRARDDEQRPYTHKLQENWRMNATLSRFPAETLYGLDYQPATPEIGQQHLGLRQLPAADQPLGWLLDPAYPLVVVILEDIQAALENIYEAELVAELAVYLRDHLCQPGTNRPYPHNEEGDRRFWRQGVFIVSPHHAQIRAIKNELAKRRRWYSPAFVDTVDKMQGQQTQCVIVSYGVSDVETALAEAEFIYSLNRLNVSVSRARAKCIVFLPRPLLTSSFAVLEQEKAIQGLAHMNALIAFCQGYGAVKQFTITSSQTQEQVRLTAYRACCG